MKVLPWLLDWPPSPATVGVFLLVTALSVGTLVAFGGVTDQATSENVTVESVDLSVRLNDDVDFPDAGNGTGTGSVQRCLASGTPGDSIGVLGDVTVDVPAEGNRDWAGGDDLSVEVSLAHTGEVTAETVDGTGRVTRDVFWVLADDETLAVGETATLQVRVRAGDSTVATATRAVTVENETRTYEC